MAGMETAGHKKFLSWEVLAMLQVITRLKASEGSSAWMVRPKGSSAVRPPQEFDLGKKSLILESFGTAYAEQACC